MQRNCTLFNIFKFFLLSAFLYDGCFGSSDMPRLLVIQCEYRYFTNKSMITLCISCKAHKRVPNHAQACILEPASATSQQSENIIE